MHLVEEKPLDSYACSKRNPEEKNMDTLTLTRLLKIVAIEFPNRRAVSISGKFDITHSQLLELVEHAASRLVNAGIGRGDVIALTFLNTIEVCFSSFVSFLHYLSTIS